jgi:hypothetical protein
MATMKTFLIAASCGMVLLGAVSAHAELSANKLSANEFRDELGEALLPEGTKDGA